MVAVAVTEAAVGVMVVVAATAAVGLVEVAATEGAEGVTSVVAVLAAAIWAAASVEAVAQWVAIPWEACLVAVPVEMPVEDRSIVRPVPAGRQ